MHLSTKALFLLVLYCLSAPAIQAQSGSQSQPASAPQPGSPSQLPSQTNGPRDPSAAKDSLAALSGLTNALKTYHNYLTPETELYRGGQYAEYTFLIAKGHPYFDIDSMIIGTVSYNGILYENVPLKYDIVKDALLTDDPYDYYKISLISEQISRFTIGQHVFIRLTDSINRTAPRVGFYEQLERELDASGFFFPPEKTPSMVRNLRAIFARSVLTSQETRTLRGVVTAPTKGRGRVLARLARERAAAEAEAAAKETK